MLHGFRRSRTSCYTDFAAGERLFSKNRLFIYLIIYTSSFRKGGVVRLALMYRDRAADKDTHLFENISW